MLQDVLKPFETGLMILFLVSAFVCLGMAFRGDASRWTLTAGALFGLSGLFQANVSGVFDRIMQEYDDPQRYPYGPPSHITRMIIDNPDAPISTAIRNYLFFDSRIGFWLLALGLIVTLVGIWLPAEGPP